MVNFDQKLTKKKWSFWPNGRNRPVAYATKPNWPKLVKIWPFYKMVIFWPFFDLKLKAPAFQKPAPGPTRPARAPLRARAGSDRSPFGINIFLPQTKVIADDFGLRGRATQRGPLGPSSEAACCSGLVHNGTGWVTEWPDHWSTWPGRYPSSKFGVFHKPRIPTMGRGQGGPVHRWHRAKSKIDLKSILTLIKSPIISGIWNQNQTKLETPLLNSLKLPKGLYVLKTSIQDWTLKVQILGHFQNFMGIYPILNA